MKLLQPSLDYSSVRKMPVADVPVQSPSPRSSATSLAATASANAASLSRQPSRSSARSSRPSFSERRRSAVLNLEDPSTPGPGELQGGSHRSSMGYAFRTASPTSLGGSSTIPTADPHHQRTPSLGELHQELEQEQEAQVVRIDLGSPRLIPAFQSHSGC